MFASGSEDRIQAKGRSMRSIWKGLIVGGLTGAAAGLIVDLGESGTSALGDAGRRARQYAPVAAERMKSAAVSGVDLVETAVSRGIGQLEQAHLPERAADVADRAADKVSQAVGQADVTQRAADLSDKAAGAVREKVVEAHNGRKGVER
jgi:hypothetical protein